LLVDGRIRIRTNKFFCLLLFEGTFISVFKDEKSKRSHKIAEIHFFWLVDGRIRIPDPDPGGPKTYGSYGSGYGSTTLEYTNRGTGQENSSDHAHWQKLWVF
jgi:hypothetical protein